MAKNTKFKRVKIKVNLQSEDEYSSNIIVRVIKFTEVDDNDLNKMK